MNRFTPNIEFLRPIKGSLYLSLHNRIHKKEELDIKEYSNINLRPLGQIDINLYKKDNLIIDDNDFCSLITPVKEQKVTLEGQVLYGGYLRKIWGHFIMGGLARIWPMLNETFASEIDRIIFIAHDKDLMNLRGNYSEIMELLGISNKCTIISYNQTLSIEKLYVPDISFEHDVFYSDSCDLTFKKIIETALKGIPSPTPSKRLFLTRSQLKNASKNEVNLSKFEQLFKDNGFEIIAPEKISISELIRLFNEADTIVSPSGSTAHNFVFIPRKQNTKTIILERHAWVNTFQTNIEKMTNYLSLHIDAFWMPKLSSSQDFTFLYDFTPQFINFIQKYSIKTDKDFLLQMPNKKGLKKFMIRHRRYYGNSESVEIWEQDSAGALIEAVVETRNYFYRWLINYEPLMWFDYFTPRFYLRKLKKKIKCFKIFK